MEKENGEAGIVGKGDGMEWRFWRDLEKRVTKSEDLMKTKKLPRDSLPRDYCQEDKDTETDLVRSCKQVFDLESVLLARASGMSLGRR